MITLEHVSKVFPGGTTAVDAVDLHVAEGEVAVLVGPSGCGKTTTLRLINRMVEPTSGRIVVDGRDASALPTHELRRGIGYVIQHTGLFPHRTIEGNIGTVPELVGWSKPAIRERAAELMELVGLPRELASRYPHQLSGGQRQRVGVARALAVDPPIMLMDEPFGAVDPIVRARLQEEFLRLQQEVRKTIVFVTHDIDEAITMGDRIAIFNVGGRLEQYASPRDLLAEPANAFVADFLGAERGLKRLALVRTSEVEAAPGPVVGAETPVEEAKDVANQAGTDWVVVVDAGRRLRGVAWLADLGGVERVGDVALQDPPLSVRAEDSLRTALDAMVTSHTGVAVRVGPEGTYEGVLTQDILTRELT